MLNSLSNSVVNSSAIKADIAEYQGSKELVIAYVAGENTGEAHITCNFAFLIDFVDTLLACNVQTLQVYTVEPNTSYTLLVDTDPYGQFEDLDREVIFEVAEYPTHEQAQAAADELNAKEPLDKLGNPVRDFFIRKNKVQN